MAGFTFGSNLKSLEENVKDYEVMELPINIASEIIGEGSSAVVFKYQLKEKPAAAKKFKIQMSKKSILKAADALAKLKHKNVVRFLGYSCKPSTILFEYCEVKFIDHDNKHAVHSLKDLVDLFNDNEYFNLKERAGYCAQACEGLSYLHSFNIIHKDIKPSNMLVSGTKENIIVKISDFNEIATFKDTCITTSTTTGNYLKGTTLAYIPPEIASGSVQSFTVNTDVYSLGMSMYEIFSNLSSAWENTIPLESLVKDALQRGLRPSMDNLTTIYKTGINHVTEAIKLCWHEDVGSRPSLSKVIQLLEGNAEENLQNIEDSNCKFNPDFKRESAKHVTEFQNIWDVGHKDEDSSASEITCGDVDPDVACNIGEIIDFNITEKNDHVYGDACLDEKEIEADSTDDENIDENNDYGGSSDKKNPYRKPYRLCIFCGKSCSKLTSHIQHCHKDHERVKQAMKMNKKDRIYAFKTIRREGIIEYNKGEARKEMPKYQCERKGRKYFQIVLCSSCSAFISKRFFYTHRRYCSEHNDAPSLPIPLYVQSLPNDIKLSDNFISKVLSKVRDDDIGRIVRKDEYILYLGHKFFKKVSHKKEKIESVLKSTRSDMRLLATLFQTFCELEGVTQCSNILDMLNRNHFHELCDAVNIMTTKENREMKAGLRQKIYYLLLKSCKHLRDRFFIENEDEQSKEMDGFLRAVKSNEDEFLSSAQYHLENNRLKKGRKPCNLPLEEDIQKIYRHICKRIRGFELITAQEFIELRNITMARLTLLNARRGGEVSRVLLSDWLEAERGGWMDQQQIKKLAKADQILVAAHKMAFQTGKGKKHLVSIIIPNDTVNAMRILSNKGIRKNCNVANTNIFVFASTQSSELPFSGWHSLKEACKNLNLLKVELINATNNRHRVSTHYAALDIPENERRLFYKHMGHSSEMNEMVYQTPLALMGMTKVGRNLFNMEPGECSKTIDNAFAVLTTEKTTSLKGECSKTIDNASVVNIEQTASLKGECSKTIDNAFAVLTTEKTTSLEGECSKTIDNAFSVLTTEKTTSLKGECSKTIDNAFSVLTTEKTTSLKGECSKTIDNASVVTIEQTASCKDKIKKHALREVGKKYKLLYSDESDTSDESQNANDQQLHYIKKKNSKWTPELNRRFFLAFGRYVRKEEPKPFPSKSKMTEFAAEAGASFTAFQVRTKINNERKKFLSSTCERLDAIGIRT